MKKGKGGKEKQKENQNTFAKEGDMITKPIPKQSITKRIPTRIKGFDY